MKENAINIFLNDENPQSPIFVEIENDEGDSLRIGKDTIDEKTGLRKIRITTADIINSQLNK